MAPVDGVTELDGETSMCRLPTSQWPGLLIAFEGLDGAGKTSHARALLDVLGSRGYDVVMTREPTSGPWGRKVREAAASGERLPPEQEISALVEDRREHVRDLILPSLYAGKVVLLDRYVLSTLVYQGDDTTPGRTDDDLITQNSFSPRADLCIVFDVPVEVALARIAVRQCEHDTTGGGYCMVLHERDGVTQPACRRCRRCGRFVGVCTRPGPVAFERAETLERVRGRYQVMLRGFRTTDRLHYADSTGEPERLEERIIRIVTGLIEMRGVRKEGREHDRRPSH